MCLIVLGWSEDARAERIERKKRKKLRKKMERGGKGRGRKEQITKRKKEIKKGMTTKKVGIEKERIKHLIFIYSKSNDMMNEDHTYLYSSVLYHCYDRATEAGQLIAFIHLQRLV